MERLLMSWKERKRLDVFGRVQAGTQKLVEASALLKLSYRQAKRAWRRYQAEGAGGWRVNQLPCGRILTRAGRC